MSGVKGAAHEWQKFAMPGSRVGRKGRGAHPGGLVALGRGANGATLPLAGAAVQRRRLRPRSGP